MTMAGEDSLRDQMDSAEADRPAIEEAESGVVDESNTRKRQLSVAEEDEGKDLEPQEAIIGAISPPLLLTPVPPKKKSKGKGKGSKAVKREDRTSVATEGTGTPDVEIGSSESVTKKGIKKATARKKNVALHPSGSTTPNQAERGEQLQPYGDIEIGEGASNGAGAVTEAEAGAGARADNEKLYCVCKSLYDEERMMIACDRCDEWYHTSCMKISEDQARLVDTFTCPVCESSTTERTTWKPKCIRASCINAALRPLSIYCSEECGVSVAAMRISKAKATKGLNPQKAAEKLLHSSRISSAKKREGIAVWTEGEDKQAWLRSVLGHELNLSVLEKEVDVDLKDRETRVRLSEIPEMEKLSRLEDRRTSLEKKKELVNASLDLLAARTKLLQLAEDRVANLEPVTEDGGTVEGARGTGTKGKSKKKAKEAVESSGQPRCGYDERLSWNDARFTAWSQTTEAKSMLEDQRPIDGTLDTDGTATLRVAVCGQSKRRCKRHSDWSVIRSAGMEMEREMQINLLSSLAEEEQGVLKETSRLKALIREIWTEQETERREGDAILAKQLASEGTRRAGVSNGHH
ncbi:hypothetical protein CBS101457_005544 [Exobasidium rhododendri]|nr:hypothetical protein CBS101457_005544 [Exobasidium rhododendri]